MPRLVILPDGRAVYAPDEMTRDQVLAASGFAAPAAPEPDVRDDEQKSDIIDDIQRGLGGLLAGTGSAIRDINEGAGRWLQERGNEIVAANPADYGSLSDISGIGDLVGFGIERLAETAPQLVGAGIASAVGSPLAGAAILAAPTGVSTYGEARQAQRDTGQESYLRAAAAGVGAGALDLLGVGRVLPGNVASKMLGDVVEGGIRGTIKSGLKVGGEEALTETGQQVLQRFGGMQELTSPEAMEEYAFSALAGGLVGGGLGAGAGAVRSFTSPTEAAPIEDVGTQGFRATAAPQIEVPPEIASAAPLATIDIPDIEAPEPGAVRTMAVLSQPDEGGRVWVRTPEGVTTQMPEVLLSQIGGTYTPFTETTAGVVPGETVGTGTTTFTVNDAPVTTSGSLQPTMPVALPIGEPVDVTAPVDATAPIEAPAPSESVPPVGAPAPIEAPAPIAAPAPVDVPAPDITAPAPVDVPAPIAAPAPVEQPAAPTPEQYVFTAEKAAEVGSHDPELAKALVGKTVSGGAEVAAQRTKSPFYQQMFNRVGGMARAMESAGIRMPIGITAIPGGRGAVSESTMTATSQPYTGGVTSLFPPVQGGPYNAFEVGMRGKPTKTAPRGANERTLLHEMIHSVTTGAQRMSDKFPTGSRVGGALKQIEALHNKVKQGAADIESGKLKVDPEVRAALARLRGSNAFLNERELLAWGMTDYDMQLVLKAIPVKGGNAFTEFVRLIGRMLGVGPKDMSALRELIELTEVVIPTEPAAQQEIIDVVTGKAGEPVTEPEAGVVADVDAEATQSPAFQRWFGGSKVVDADGKPLVVYHGTQGEAFDIFKPGAWFSENPSESSAYTFASDIPKRDRATGKYRIASGAELAGQRVPYAGILADIENKEVGGVYATDNGVYRSLGNGKWEVFSDLDSDYDDFDYDSMTVVLRRGDFQRQAEDLIRDYEGAVERAYPGGVGGRVYPVYLSIKNPIKLPPLEANRIARRLGMGDADIDAKIREYEAAGYDGIETTSDEATLFPEVFEDLGGIPRQWVAFRPEQIKSATGNRGTFDPNRPEIDRQQQAPTPRPIVQYSLGDETKLDAFKRRWVDKNRRLYFVEEMIAQQQGAPIPRTQRPTEKAALFEGRADTRIQELQRDHFDKIVNAIKDEGLQPHEVDTYLISRAAFDRNAKVARRNPEMPDGGIGITNAIAQQNLLDAANSGRLPALQRIAELYDAMTKQTRDTMVEYGLLSKKQADALVREEPFYVPAKGTSLEGDFTEAAADVFSAPGSGRGFSVPRKEYLAAKGRRSLPFSPLATAMNDAAETIVRGERNRVGQSFLDDIARKYDSNAWEVFTDENPDTTLQYVQKSNTVRRVPVDMAANSKNYFVVKKQGKPYYIKIEDPLLLRVLTNGSTQDFSAVNRFLGNTIGRVTRMISQLHTTLNPEFVIPNIIRDVEAAAFNIAAEQDMVDGRLAGKKIVAGVMKDIKSFDNFKRLAKATFNHEATTAEQRQTNALFQQAKEDGAFTGWILYSTPEEHMAKIKGELESATATGKKKAWYSTKAGAKKVIDWVQDLNSVFENTTRFAVYKNALDAGLTRDEAANMARNVTVDFNRKGEAGPTVNALYAFFNASIQGNVQLLRTLTRKKVDGTYTMAQKAAFGLVGFGILQTMIARALSDEDDDGSLFYDKIPDWEKERNMIFMLPNGQDYIKIPLPYGYSFFHTLGRTGAELSAGVKSVGDFAMGVLSGLINNFSPLPISGSSISGVAASTVPTALRPFADLMINENFFGSPIYNEPFDENQAKSSVSRYSTPEGYKAVVEFLNEVTGGKGKIAGAVDIPAESIQYLINYYIGGMGKFAGDALGFAKGAATGEGVENIKDVPLMRKLLGTPNEQNDLGLYYDRLNAIEPAARQLKDSDASERALLREKFPVETNPRIISALKQAKQQLKDANKIKRNLLDRDMDDVERQRRLDALDERIHNTYLRFNRTYNQVEEREG